MNSLRQDLEAVSRALQALHKQILEAEGAYLPGRSSLELRDEAFLGRYRPLLQVSPALASAHGELKRLIDSKHDPA